MVSASWIVFSLRQDNRNVFIATKITMFDSSIVTWQFLNLGK